MPGCPYLLRYWIILCTVIICCPVYDVINFGHSSKQIKTIFLQGESPTVRYKSKYLCCHLQNKIINNHYLQSKKIQVTETITNCIWLDQNKRYMITSKLLFFITQFSPGKTDKVSDISFLLSSVNEEP